MSSLLSPRQIAEALGASESSVKRWCDQGLLSTVKTAGGHRRITASEALRFAREQNYSVVEPQILSLPASDDRKARRIEGCAERLVEGLISENELACRTIVFDLYLGGCAVSQIFDDVLGVAFRIIGEKWECHEAAVYQERCSCQIALRLLHELRGKLVPPKQELLALGATLEGDQYLLPVTMADIVLRSVGWDARLLGSSIPLESIEEAIRRNQPRLFWLSVSHIPDEGAFIAGFERLYLTAAAAETPNFSSIFLMHSANSRTVMPETFSITSSTALIFDS